MNIQKIIIFFIPFYILLSVYTAIQSLPANKYIFILFLFFIVYFSNVFTLLFTSIISHKLLSLSNYHVYQPKNLEILYLLSIKPIIPNYLSIIIGITLGIAYKTHLKISENLNLYLIKTLDSISYFIKYYMQYVIYAMLLGIFINIFYSRIIYTVIYQFYNLFITIIIIFFALLSVYVSLLYMHAKNIICKIKNIIPAIITGTSATSSTLAIPQSISATYKNTNDKCYSKLITPILTNIHNCGDSVIIGSVNILIIMLFNNNNLPIQSIFIFILVASVYKLSSAGIPGGGALILHPVLKSFLGYDDNMINFITSMYIILDHFATLGNILFNNILSIILYNYYKTK